MYCVIKTHPYSVSAMINNYNEITKSRASNLIVLVEYEIKHETFNKELFLNNFLKIISTMMIVLLLAIYRGIDSE